MRRSKDFVVLKIFRLENSRFQNPMTYITGDPRFGRVKHNIFGIVNEWCKKEYGNLLVAESAKIHAPMPYAFNGNVLALEFIGDENGKASRPLREVRVKDPEKVLDTILEDARRLYKHELVHADLSQYNILMKDETPYMIDFGQAVNIEHPDSRNYLERDVHNILNYFSKAYKIDRDIKEVYKQITG